MKCERCDGESGPYRKHPNPHDCVEQLETELENARQWIRKAIAASLAPDADGIVWFTFDGPEAVGEVGVRKDVFGLGLYLRKHPDPTVDLMPCPLATVDLFHASPSGRPLVETPYVQLVVDDMGSNDIIATARFLPDHTVVELEHDNFRVHRSSVLRLVVAPQKED